jgi:8-oxo-dGTP diphosphatase
MVASVVIRQNNKYLLIQEGQGKAKGLWNFPGGHVDPGETLRQAAEREAKEETGLKVKIGIELFVLPMDELGNELHAFAATILGGTLATDGKEILSARWLSITEIQAMTDHLRNVEYINGAIQKAEMTQ